MTESTLTALEKLRYETYQIPNISEEEFIKLRNKYLNCGKIKWIKHIYSCGNNTDNDSRYDFLNVTTHVVLDVIIERLRITKSNWEGTRSERVNKWRRIYKANFEK